MDIFHSLSEIPANYGPTVATIGNFDGVHRGHQWLISKINQRARDLGGHSVAVTFDPHPARYLRPADAPKLVTPLPERLQLLQQAGIDGALVLPFNDELCKMSGPEFVVTILSGALHAAEVHEGDNFRFGYRAQSHAEDLVRMGHDLGFRVNIFSPCFIRGIQVSSSKVRELVESGDMATARALLGRPFSIVSTPASGRGIGTKLTVPTINLAPYYELLPASGVYITRLEVSDECFDAVTNAGNRPTFGQDSYAVESHLLNFHPIELTPETPIKLSFLHRLRAERKFASPEALKTQILVDVGRARRYFRIASLFQSGILQHSNTVPQF